MWIAPERSEVVRARTQSRARLLRRENHQLVRSLPPRSSVLRSSPQAETARSQGQGLCAARKPAVQERSESAGRADGAGSSTASCCGATRRARSRIQPDAPRRSERWPASRRMAGERRGSVRRCRKGGKGLRRARMSPGQTNALADTLRRAGWPGVERAATPSSPDDENLSV